MTLEGFWEGDMSATSSRQTLNTIIVPLETPLNTTLPCLFSPDVSVPSAHLLLSGSQRLLSGLIHVPTGVVAVAAYGSSAGRPWDRRTLAACF